MPTLIIGSEGSMGTRYKAILKYLGDEYRAMDISLGMTEREIFRGTHNYDRIILCTPTENHYQWLEKLIPLGKPILCEKPITKSLLELEYILKLVAEYKTPFTMTFQYSELVSPHLEAAPSKYNYFRTGKDGLIWDCLQIIALAKGEVEIENNSPIWSCKINGLRLKLGDMDAAYLNFVGKWRSGLITQTPDLLMSIHEKTERLANARKSN